MTAQPTERVRCLFVAHDAYRAGATIFLLNMLRWFKANSDMEFEVALRDDGEMVQHFAALAPTHVLAPPTSHPGRLRQLRRWMKAAISGRAQSRKSLSSLLANGRFNVLYLNTITLGDQLAALEDVRVPVITHVHELASAIRRYARGLESLVVERSMRLICVSDVVRANLVASFPNIGSKAQLIYGFVPLQSKDQSEQPELRRRHLGPLGIGPDALVVGLCGHGDLRKGADLVVPLAALLPVALGGRELHVIWVGVQAPEYPRDVALDDAKRAGVSSRVHFPGVTDKPLEWIASFDVHLLLSREDPFPLVVMEAAGLRVPTLAFADAGGAAEFIAHDAGACVPYLNLPAMAAALVAVLTDEAALAQMGQVAQRRVQERHSPDVVLPQILRVIEEVASVKRDQTTNPRAAS